MPITQKRQRYHPFSRSPSDSTSKTGSRTIRTGPNSSDRYIAVTPKERVLAKSVRTASDVLSVHADARPSGCCCCRHGRPPLMMLAWSIGPRSVAIQTTRSCTKSCSSCLHASPLTSCSAGCRASLQVWHPHEAIEALACGTFSSIVWLAYMLVDQPCKSAW